MPAEIAAAVTVAGTIGAAVLGAVGVAVAAASAGTFSSSPTPTVGLVISGTSPYRKDGTAAPYSPTGPGIQSSDLVNRFMDQAMPDIEIERMSRMSETMSIMDI